MATEITKCPLCGTKLKMINGRMGCKECGYFVRDQNEQSVSQNTSSQGNTDPFSTSRQSNSTTGQSSTGSNRYSSTASQSRTTNQSSSSHSTSQQGRREKSAGKGAAVLGIIGAAVLSVFLGLFRQELSQFLYNLFQGGGPTNDEQIEDMLDELKKNPTPYVITSAPSKPNTSDSSKEDVEKSDVVLPKSEFFQEMAEVIWGKSYRDITEKEYASLTAIQIDRSNKTIYYQLDNGETKNLTYVNDSGKKLSDLACFTGLGFISLQQSLSKGDLKGLNNLWGIYADNTIEEFVDIIPNPSGILELGIEDSFLKKNLEGIEKFPNLQYLSVDYGSLEDISAILRLPGLHGLTLIDCDHLTDYAPLKYLAGLEELSIESVQLKTIDFIKAMPNLTSLSIENSAIESLDALTSCPKISYLSLTGNYYIEDYSSIGELSQMVTMNLELDYGGTLPSFEKMKQLQTLSLKYAGDLTPLKDAVNVTYLSLERCSGWELEALTSMQELQTLVIHDFSSYVDSLEPLTRLPKLTALDLSETPIFGNIEEIFSIPTLRYLWLNECQVGMDFDAIPVNETLEILAMNEIRILYDPTYNNWDTIKLSEHYDMFSKFPNLTELYLVSDRIDSLDFVENLPKLRFLDITDNNVTSLKPLEGLKDLVTVWCGKNTILESLPGDSSVIVITD